MPEAILLQDVEQLGEQGKVVDVSKGYLRNYLVPRKLAQPATRGAIEAINQRQEAAERAERNAIEKAQENVNLLNRTVLTIPQQAGADGRLFGSVTAQDIATAIREARGLKIDKRGVHLPEPIKNVGTYMVVVDVVEGVHRDDQDHGRREEVAGAPPPLRTCVRGEQQNAFSVRDSGERFRVAIVRRSRLARVHIMSAVATTSNGAGNGAAPHRQERPAPRSRLRTTSTPSSRCSVRSCCPIARCTRS